MPRKNAVERRLDLLHDQWVEFTQQPRARMLRWVVEPDEVRMVEAWLEKESDERIGECPDLLLRFDTPFEQPETYGQALYEALNAMVVKAGEEGVDTAALKPGQPGTDTFFSACKALRHQYESMCDVLAVVLVPAHVADAKAWRQWLSQALERMGPPGVRMVVLDDARTRLLEPLALAEPERVRTAVAALDMPTALEEVARAAASVHQPAGRYRELLVLLSTAAQRGSLRQVERLGEEAVKVAAGQAWHALVVAARWAIGGALLAAGQAKDAMAHYRQAEAVAAEAEVQGAPHGAELRLKSRMAIGAALVSLQDWGPAAALYEETAPMARKQTDARLELECWRMASFCRESARELDKAWEDGQQAWEVGKVLEPEARATSTLPYVAEARVRLGQARQGTKAARVLEAEAKSLLGSHWRPNSGAAGGPLE
jgi:tetratricopeptide (TPR) repeat protein